MVAKPTRRTQEERREESERRMLEAAVRLVAERGLDNLRLADVGVLAGYSRGLPAHHFGAKANFEVALVNFISEEYHREMSELHREPGLPGLLKLIRAYCDLTKDPICLCVAHVVLSDLGRGPETAEQFEELAKLRQVGFDEVERHLQEGMERGEIRKDIDAKRMSFILVTAINGIMAAWLIDRSIDMVSAGEDIVSLVLLGIATQGTEAANVVALNS